MLPLAVCALLLVLLFSVEASNDNEIKIGFMLDARSDGLSLENAVSTMVDIVNSDHGLDLGGRKLTYVMSNDTACNASKGLQALTSLLVSQPDVAGLVGPECSSVCQATSSFAGFRNVLQISHYCIEPSLSNKILYPTFARTILYSWRKNVFNWSSILNGPP
mmetsp:Transcript_36077/g.70928  ORF Transcript_36077/g.70928 Transcript_36077/m.70928 type:complete len:162 (+) Transcript_36077:163-648(+)